MVQRKSEKNYFSQPEKWRRGSEKQSSEDESR
jgi:hypothetical protein